MIQLTGLIPPHLLLVATSYLMVVFMFHDLWW